MATNTDAKYHYSIASALQSGCQSHCQRESEYKYSCQDNIMLLKKIDINVSNDESHNHPHSFCGAC